MRTAFIILLWLALGPAAIAGPGKSVVVVLDRDRATYQETYDALLEELNRDPIDSPPPRIRTAHLEQGDLPAESGLDGADLWIGIGTRATQILFEQRAR